MKKLTKMSAACACLALYYISGQAEDTVLRICKAHGYKEGEGMSDDSWKAAATQLGINLRGLAIEPHTLRQFIKNHPEGLYLVATHDHIFVVDNNLVIDPRYSNGLGLRRIIRQSWAVIKP